jgi:transcriptional regulator with XRE-family HTH domain
VQDIPIGERIRLFRLGRGMTQEQLAGLADVSPSWVSKAERGLPIDRRMAPLSKVAKVLGVTVAELVGQRLPLPNGPEGRNGKLGALRRAILPGVPTVRVEETVDVARLLNEATETWRIRQACQYSTLGAILPRLIARGEQARRELDGPERASACEALATIYASASSLSAELGEIELAVASVALAARMAQETGMPTLEGIIARRTSLVLLRTGDETQALDLCVAAAQEIETIPRSPLASRARRVRQGADSGNTGRLGHTHLDNRGGTGNDDTQPADTGRYVRYRRDPTDPRLREHGSRRPRRRATHGRDLRLSGRRPCQLPTSHRGYHKDGAHRHERPGPPAGSGRDHGASCRAQVGAHLAGGRLLQAEPCRGQRHHHPGPHGRRRRSTTA